MVSNFAQSFTAALQLANVGLLVFSLDRVFLPLRWPVYLLFCYPLSPGGPGTTAERSEFVDLLILNFL